MTHHLTEPECDHLRTKLLTALSESIGTSNFDGIRTALEIFDTHRSHSFRTRHNLPSCFIGIDLATGPDFQSHYPIKFTEPESKCPACEKPIKNGIAGYCSFTCSMMESRPSRRPQNPSLHTDH